MTDTPSPTPEEIEAAAMAMTTPQFRRVLHVGGLEYEPAQDTFIEKYAEIALKAAMAVRGRKEIVSPSISFKEGQIVTCEGLKPMLVTISKNGKVVLVPKDEG
jgi:hypothetical protein